MLNDEEQDNVTRTFIYMAQHDYFIGFEHRKKIFLMSHAFFVSTAKVTGGVHCFKEWGKLSIHI